VREIYRWPPSIDMHTRNARSCPIDDGGCTANMEIHLRPDLQAKLDRVAAENNRDAEEDVRQLVEHYVDHDAWFRQQVKRGLDQLDRGESLTHKEMGARIEQMFRS
jgi:predicted transcriptional regulator